MNLIIKYFILYIEELAAITMEMAPYIMLGFLFAGILHVIIREKVLQKYFGNSDLKSVIYAALFGVPMPLCSCGVIPTGISLFRHGASRGATVSFLISTPQTGVDSIFATYSLIGLPFALIRVIVAFISGILGGILTNLFDSEPNKSITEDQSDNRFPLRNPIGRIFQYAFIEFLQDIAKWLLIGLLLAAFIAVVIPDNFFDQYIGNRWLEMLIILLVSIPLYICATGSVPVAAMLMMKGLSPGAALVFLMAGPATNAATMTVLVKALGKKTFMLYLISIIGSALFFGAILNFFIPENQLFNKLIHYHHHQHFSWLQITAGIIFSILTINALALKYGLYRLPQTKKEKQLNITAMNQITIFVNGMTCNHCKANVEKNLKNIEGITDAEADISKNTVLIRGEAIDLSKVEEIINQLGYQYAGKQ